MASPTAKREQVEPEVTTTEEVIMDRGEEEDLPVDHPATIVAMRPPPVPDVSPTQRASSSSFAITLDYCLLGLSIVDEALGPGPAKLP